MRWLLFYIFSAFAFSILVVSLLLQKPLLDVYAPHERDTVQVPVREFSSDLELLRLDSLNMDMHYQFVYHYVGSSDEPALYVHYQQQNTKNRAYADRVNCSLGLYFYYKYFDSLTLYHLDKVEDRNLRYLNFTYALLYERKTMLDSALYFYERELAVRGYIDGAYSNLMELLISQGRLDKLAYYARIDEARPFIDKATLKELDFLNLDIVHYYSHYAFDWTIVGLTASLLILFTWLFYLRRLDIYEPEPWATMLLMLLGGMASVLLAFPLYDFYNYVVHFERNGEFVNDFFFCVFGIGFIEETVKIIPFLLLLLFSKKLSEPIDYIIYASVSALGFAFVENLIYIGNDDVEIIHGRAFMAAVAHMFDTSIVAYGLILSAFKRDALPSFLNFPLFFLLACLAHGFYDFWLINPLAQNLYYLTIFFYLGSVLIWISFINNAINNSIHYNKEVVLDVVSLKKYLIISLSVIVLFEYWAIALFNGSEAANRNLEQTSIMQIFLLFFLASNFSNFDIVYKYWAPINFYNVINKVKYNALVGHRIRLFNYQEEQELASQLPLVGRILHRDFFSKETNYFIVRLHKPLYWAGKPYFFIFIRPQVRNRLMKPHEQMPFVLYVLPDMKELANPSKRKSSLERVGLAFGELLGVSNLDGTSTQV